MKLVIKILKGEEFNVEVTEDATILQVKEEIEKKSDMPVEYQKLLQLGKTLSDEKTISFYSNITDGTKLTLVMKKPDTLKDAMYRQFRRHLLESQSQELTKKFMADFDAKMQQFSLDDLEKIATEALARKAQKK